MINNLYVIYYGWLISDTYGTPNSDAVTIARARPKALIASFYTFEPKYPNMSQQVRALLQNAGIQIFAYVDTDYGLRPLSEVEAEAIDYLNNNVDGIFFDQVYNFLDDALTPYYRSLYMLTHSYNKRVIVNTGVAETGEGIMSVTDILMVEHAWRELYQMNPWHVKYEPERFMGNSSNEWTPEECMGYIVDSEKAVQDTQEAWTNGIGWHFSTDRYIELPNWFSDYVHQIGDAR